MKNSWFQSPLILAVTGKGEGTSQQGKYDRLVAEVSQRALFLLLVGREGRGEQLHAEEEETDTPNTPNTDVFSFC